MASLYHSFSNADLVAELKAVSEHLKLTSRLDGLTGIANRAHLDDSLARPGVAATVPGRPFSGAGGCGLLQAVQ